MQGVEAQRRTVCQKPPGSNTEHSEWDVYSQAAAWASQKLLYTQPELLAGRRLAQKLKPVQASLVQTLPWELDECGNASQVRSDFQQAADLDVVSRHQVAS